MFSHLSDAGIGILMSGEADHQFSKDNRFYSNVRGLRLAATKTFLIEHRVPSFLFGVSSRILSTGTSSAQPDASKFVATLPGPILHWMAP